jgi:hypothetical protein
VKAWDEYDTAAWEGLRNTTDISGRQYNVLAQYLRERFVLRTEEEVTIERVSEGDSAAIGTGHCKWMHGGVGVGGQ